MRCPACGDTDTRVVDSRVNKEGAEIRRRRHCDKCAHRFTTYERPEIVFPMVVKKDGRREPWDKNKIMRGLSKAFEKRPVSIEKIDTLIDEIEKFLGTYGEREIAAEKIGEMVMSKLRILDDVAYVRFASVYRSFKDIDEFMSELAHLVKKRENPGRKES